MIAALERWYERWLARRAFNSLGLWMNGGGVTHTDYNRAIETMDVLRKYMHKDYE